MDINGPCNFTVKDCGNLWRVLQLTKGLRHCQRWHGADFRSLTFTTIPDRQSRRRRIRCHRCHRLVAWFFWFAEQLFLNVSTFLNPPQTLEEKQPFFERNQLVILPKSSQFHGTFVLPCGCVSSIRLYTSLYTSILSGSVRACCTVGLLFWINRVVRQAWPRGRSALFRRSLKCCSCHSDPGWV